MSSLKNKNIIITSYMRIVIQLLQNLHENGANILATGTRIEKLEELKKKVLHI